MADEVARVAFELDTSGMVAGAKAGESSLSALQDQLEQDTQAVSDLQKAIRLLRGATSANAETIDEMKKRLTAAKNSMGSTASQIVQMGGNLTKSKKEETKSWKEYLSATGRAPGMFGSLARTARVAAGSLGKAGLYGALILAGVALAALPFAVGGAVAALTKLAAGFRDARRSEMIMLEGMTRRRYWWGYIPGKASEVQAAIDSVSDATATGRDKIAEYARTLYRAGLRGGDLSSMLEAVSMKASVQGEEAAERFMGMAYGARMLGVSVKQMADTAKARLQDLNAKQIIGFNVQIRKLRENLPRLFDTVNIEGFLGGMRKVTELFSLSTVNGEALQHAIGNLFSIITGQSSSSANVFRDMIRGMVIGLQHFTIKMLDLEMLWLRFKKQYRDMLNVDPFKVGISASEIMYSALMVTFYAAIGVAAAFTAIGAGADYAWKGSVLLAKVMIVSFGAAAAAVAGFVAFIISPLLAIGYLAVKVADSWRKNWKSGGKAIVQGIIEGIKSDFEAAKKAVVELGGSLKNWFKESLGIKSPSKEFRIAARAIPQGTALGVKDEQQAPRLAVQNMVSPSTMTAAASWGTRNSSQSVKVDVGGVHMHTTASTIEGATSDLESAIAGIFERAAIQMGAA